ncbi:response regulator [Brevundimonas sp. VNH65]|uniref:response regulator n=1 Tax=Brevundimonas sp. VNH65 TaxID=3400917 RepID=UPI003BFECDF9
MAAILVVDDDPAVRAIATEMLATDGHAIVEAVDGVEALALAAHLPIDLVIVDMLMPKMDGLETIAALRAAKSGCSIIAISSGGLLNAGGLLRMALAAGADASLEKPLRLATLRETIGSLLECGSRSPHLAIGRCAEG